MIRAAVIMLFLTGCSACGATKEDVQTAEGILLISAPVAAAICHAAGGNAEVCNAIRDIACTSGPEPKCALIEGTK